MTCEYKFLFLAACIRNELLITVFCDIPLQHCVYFMIGSITENRETNPWPCVNGVPKIACTKVVRVVFGYDVSARR